MFILLRCVIHGTCEGGVCTCDEGWGGTHCTLDYCPQSCSGHGRSMLTKDVFNSKDSSSENLRKSYAFLV